jgi:hypothetical protein
MCKERLVIITVRMGVRGTPTRMRHAVLTAARGDAVLEYENY